jgi:hypothetical protein
MRTLEQITVDPGVGRIARHVVRGEDAEIAHGLRDLVAARRGGEYRASRSGETPPSARNRTAARAFRSDCSLMSVP